MGTEARIVRYRKSFAVRIPVGIAREFDLRDGDRVMLRTVGGGILIERPRRSRLAARLATVREREAEIAAGPAAGAESSE